VAETRSIRRDEETKEARQESARDPVPLIGLARNMAQARLNVVSAIVEGVYGSLGRPLRSSGEAPSSSFSEWLDDTERRRRDLVRDVAASIERFVRSTTEAPINLLSGAVAPAVVRETDEDFLVQAELPGVKSEDVTVKVRNGHVSITGEREEEFDEGISRRRRTKTYNYEAEIRADIDEASAEATLEQGLLTVRFPKTGAERSRRIEVRVRR
jgi:HSP20 family protein